jgi:biotin carboxyl carrier protein
MAGRSLTFVHGDREYLLEIVDAGTVRVGDRTFQVAADGIGSVRIAGDRTVRAWTAAAGDTRWVFLDGRVYEFEVKRGGARKRGSAHHGSLTAPMPATVRRVLVGTGDTVERGDLLVILEAMKMELPVRADAAGRIAAVHCREGELVQAGVTLVELDEE